MTSTNFSIDRPMRDGVRAKLGYILHQLGRDDLSRADESLLEVALLDGLPSFLRVLDAAELADLRVSLESLIDGFTADNGVWWAVKPSRDLSGDALEGVNVPVVHVDGEVELAEISGDGQAGDDLVVVSETSVSRGSTLRLELVDSSGRVLDSAQAPTGNHLLSTLRSVGGTAVCLRAKGSGEMAPSWYRADVVSGPPAVERGPSVATPLQTLRAAVPAPTGEPLLLDDIDRLVSLKDRFRGERIFVMGNGPSLNSTPLDKLDDEFVFGMNRVSLLFDRVNWRPTFFTAFDVRVVPDNQEEFAQLDVPYKFFSARYKPLMGERQNHYWYHTKGFYEGFEAAFLPTVPYSGFGGGGTIAVIAIELAFFMGFREIYLIGTDVSYSVPDTVEQSGPDQFGDGVKLELESTRNDDPNHFDPRYFGAGKKWHNPNVREMKIGFGRAAAYVERHGGRLRNATVGGELEEVERVDFGDLFPGGSQ